MKLPSESSMPQHNTFLSGGGETGAIIRSFDWSQTSLGAMESWPQSLRTTLSIVINSKFPMFLFWGEELLCFYNDAYRPSLGNDGKHPSAIGKPGHEVWPEIWSTINPIIDNVLTGGEASWNEDELLPIYRNGKIEDAYWTFSYSPVNDESGKPAGVFVTCTETTNKIDAFEKLQISDNRFHNLVDQANVGLIVLHGMEMRVDVVNEQYGILINSTPEELINKPLFDIIPQAEEYFRPLLTNVLTTGEPLYLYDAPYAVTVKGEAIDGFLDVVYQPYIEDDGVITGVIAIVHNVTEKVRSRNKIQDAAEQLGFAIEAAELGTWDYNPQTGKFTGNDRLKDWFGLVPEDEIELSLALAMIADKDRKKAQAAIEGALQYGSGGTYDIIYTIVHPQNKTERIVRAKGKAWFNHDNIAYRFNGTLQDVTEQTTAAEKIKRSEEELRAVIDSAPFPIGVYLGREMRILLANQTILDVWGKGNDVIGKLYTDILPELSESGIFEQLQNVFDTGIAFHAKNTRVDIFINGKLSPFYFNYSFTPLFDGSGKVYGVMNTAADVTDLNMAHRKSEESESRFRSLIEQSSVAKSLFTGPDLVIEMANDIMIGYWGKGKSVIGKPLKEALPELNGQPFLEILYDIYTTGETYSDKEAKTILEVDGELQTFYFNFTYKPMRDSNGEIYAIMDTAIDVTEQVLNRKKIEESEQFARSIINNSVIAQAVWTGEDMLISTVNQQMLELLGRDDSIIGMPFMDVIPELKNTPILERMRHVLHTGETFYESEEKFDLIRHGQKHTGYYSYTYQPLRNAEGEIYGVLNSASEVTAQVLARKKIEESEQRFRSLIAAAPIAIGVFVGRDLVIETHNQTFLDIVGKGDNIEGLPLREAMPELISEGQPFLKILDDVYTKGMLYQTYGTQVKIVQNGIMTYNYYDITYTPIYNSDGEVFAVLDIAIDVTENVLAQKRIEESEKNLRNMILQAPVAMCILRNTNQVVEIANDLMLELWGTSKAIFGKSLMEGIPELEGQGFDLLLDHVYTTGETYKAYDVPVRLPRSGGIETVYVDFVYEAFREIDNTISGVLVVAIDVTQQVLSRKKIEEAEEKARLAIESADLGSYEVDLATDEMKTSERFDSIWGFDRFAGRAERATAIHPEDREMRANAHQESLVTGNLHYESRLIRKNGDIDWVRVKGKLLFDKDGVPVTLLGIIQDITEQKRFAEQLTKLVKERTTELNRSNEDLLHFAHIASHDLKEPVRKIKVFSNMLEEQFGELLPEKGLLYLNKVQNATDRMFSMIEGILTYSAVNASDQPIEKINLNEILQSIELDLEVLIQFKNADIKIDSLPVIEGGSVLIYQLFYNLINNALKFSKADVKPEISIFYSKIKRDKMDWAEIVVSDNGIGLNQNYAEQIFTAFTRLHAKDKYEGTGLGLALCKKIVERHHGTISASGVINEGATFTMMLPFKQPEKIL